LLTQTIAPAGVFVGNWEPLFKGIEHASGQAIVDASTPRQQQVQALRVDLRDPDVKLFSTPRATNGPLETFGQNTSLFLKTYGVNVAINANFYDPCCSATPGQPMNVTGLAISRGVVVSQQESATDSSVIMFTSNNVGTIVANNWPPHGTNGIYTAIAGHYVVLANGVNLGFSTPEASTPNPRTAVGISQDGRYLIMLTIDGRQPGWSDGAVDSETASWLIRFGSYNGLNLDGGGSSAMVKADCDGSPIQLNRSIDRGIPGAERVIANNFGVFAKPLPYSISNVVAVPSDATTTITWETPEAATAQIEYGTTGSYGLVARANSPSLKKHVITLNGLSPNTTYYFRITSILAGNTYTYSCKLVTSSGAANTTWLFDVTKSWKYTTNNLDGTGWQAAAYNDGSWSGPGAGLLYVESSASVNPKTTGLPPSYGPQLPAGTGVAPTYYFRTHFTFNGNPAGATLTFSNFVDDGAVFYLNGVEMRRLRMAAAPAAITYTSVTDPPGAYACTGDATCPDVFIISGPLITNLVSGDNVLAVEVHQYQLTSNDIVFGSALGYSVPGGVRPFLNLIREQGFMTLYWNGSGFTLQQADAPEGPWIDVPGPVTNSAYAFEIPSDIKFYRLRN